MWLYYNMFGKLSLLNSFSSSTCESIFSLSQNFAFNAFNSWLDCSFSKTKAFYSDNLSTCDVTFFLINRIDGWNSFGLITGGAIILTIVHSDWVMDGIACLPKHVHWKIVTDLLISNFTFDFVVGPSLKTCVIIDIAFKVDVCESNLGLNEWQVISLDIHNFGHDALWIKDKFHNCILVYNWRRNVFQHWRQVSVID